ncbi:MAG: family 78 glycoside hydrolase catalytic domain, partial [Roseiflexaceae bacterium]
MHALRPVGLRTEYLAQPRGIHTHTPRLSWHINGEGQNRRQTAYQIQVALDPKALKAGTMLLWDSGKVGAELAPAVRYGGPALTHGQHAHWMVRVWDEHDTPSAWSKISFWQHGIDATAWESAAWIAFPTPKDVGEMSQPVAVVRHGFMLPKTIASATLYATALGLYQVHINGQIVGDRVLTPGWTDYNHRVMYQAYDVKALLSKGTNVIAAMIGDGWYCGYLGFEGNFSRYGDFPALRCRLDITYSDGSSTSISSNPTWRGNTGHIRAADFYMGASIDYTKTLDGWDTVAYDDRSWKPVQTVSYHGEMSPDTSPPLRIVDTLPVVRITQPAPKVYIVDFGQIYAGVMRLRVSGNTGQKIVMRYGEILNPDGSLHTINLRAAKQTDTFILDGQPRWLDPTFTYKGFRYVEISGLDKPPKPA